MSMRAFSTRGSRRATVFAITAAVTVAGVAGASWSASSNGNAKAQAGRLQPVTATAATPSQELFPGGTADAALTLTNPNPVAMTVSSIVGNGAITSDSAACNDAGHGVTFTDQTGAWEVAKGAALPVSLADVVSMAIDSADACQGATFTIPVAVTASVSGQGGGGTPSTTTSTTAPAQLAWTPASHTYPSAEVNVASQTQPFSLRNTGGAPAQVEMGALGSADFVVVSNGCGGGMTLAPNQGCTVALRFHPTSAGHKFANVQARISGATAWTTATMSGFAYTPASLQFTPTAHNFGSQGVSTEGPTFTFELRNVGQGGASNVSVTLQGLDQASFVIRNNSCGFTLASGQPCFIAVSFRPSHTGANTATLRASYATASSGSNVAQATLNGTGV